MIANTGTLRARRLAGQLLMFLGNLKGSAGRPALGKRRNYAERDSCESDQHEKDGGRRVWPALESR
jgi:hypothetical protein